MRCCCDCLNREMNYASDRNMYRNIFHQMTLLKSYPGGQAMLDEMKKARKEKVI